MYSNTLFHEILKALPSNFVKEAVNAHDAERYDKTFKLHQHLVALIFAQLTSSKSLRELEVAFNSQPEVHYHLGVTALKKSTLSDANKRHNAEVFKHIAERLMQCMHRKQRKELREFIYLLDSTPIHLSGLGYEWADGTVTQRTRGLKTHVLMDLTSRTPIYVNTSAPNKNDISDAQEMPLESGVTYVFDKGYYSFRWWNEIDELGSVFVTRFKQRAGVVAQRTISDGEGEVIKDEEVRFKRSGHPNPYLEKPLRRITVHRDGKKPLVIATNDFNRSAQELAELYKQRWQIELFFKWIKQNLKIKRFLGRSQNSVLIQIYTAIITYILLWKYQQQQNHSTSELYLLLVQIRQNLFNRQLTDYQRQRRRSRKQNYEWAIQRQGILPI